MTIPDIMSLGSVVMLKGGQKRVMVYGRVQREAGTDRIWDYVGCLFPEGHVSQELNFLFDHDQIDKISFIGFQDEEELAFADYLREHHDELRSGAVAVE